MGSREASLRLYREMMREASRLPDFNFRSYFQRRIRDGFRSAPNLEVGWSSCGRSRKLLAICG